MNESLINYDEILDNWNDKVIKKADEMYEKSQEFELGSPNYFKYKSYADGLYMSTSMLSNEERIYKRHLKNAKPLFNDKKKTLKDFMGSASSQIDLNKVRDEWRENNERN